MKVIAQTSGSSAEFAVRSGIHLFAVSGTFDGRELVKLEMKIDDDLGWIPAPPLDFNYSGAVLDDVGSMHVRLPVSKVRFTIEDAQGTTSINAILIPI